MPTSPLPITLALLAGGQGTRMGQPKSHLRLAGLPILEYLHSKLQWQGPTLLITAPSLEHPPAHQLFTREIPDPIANQGPLRGIHTALNSSDTDIVVFTTVDMPNVTRLQLEYLATELTDRPTAAGVMLQHPSPLPNSRDLIEPFPCALRRPLLPELTRRLETGKLSLQSLARSTFIAVVPAPADWPATTCLNLNHPEDLAAFECNPEEQETRPPE